MKIFETLYYWIALVVGAMGVIGILAAWWLQWSGQPEIYSLTQGHFLNYSLLLFLAAIWLMLVAFWHKGLGK